MTDRQSPWGEGNQDFANMETSSPKDVVGTT